MAGFFKTCYSIDEAWIERQNSWKILIKMKKINFANALKHFGHLKNESINHYFKSMIIKAEIIIW